MAHTDVVTFLADKAVVQRVCFTTQLRCVLDFKIIPKAKCCLKWEKRNNLQ